MQYDTQIDDTIFQELSQTESLKFLALKTKIDAALNRKISFDTYNFHLQMLVKEGVLLKQDAGQRGKPVFYSLSENAKRQKVLNILGLNEKQLFFRKVYEKLFFHSITIGWPIYFDDIDAFLAELNTDKSALIPSGRQKWDTAYIQKDGVKLKDPFIAQEQYYKVVRDMSIVKSTYTNKRTKEKHIQYYAMPIGVSIDEFIEKGFKEEKPNRNAIEEAFTVLLKNGLVRMTQFRNVTRYIITDERLENLAEYIQFVIADERFMLEHKWQYVSPPTKDEIERHELSLGKSYTRKFVRDAEIFRHQLKQTKVVETGSKEKSDDHLSILADYQKSISAQVNRIKRKYKLVLEEYYFLQDVLRQVCPMIVTSEKQ